MELVVKNFALLSGSLHISELPAANCVSDRTLSGSLENVDGTIGDSYPRLNHNLVDHSWVADHLEFALTIDLCEAGEHCRARNSILIEHQVAIVNRVIAELSANITNGTPWECRMRLHVPNRHNKRLNAVVFTVCDATGVEKGRVSLPSEVSRPELGRLERRRMNHELICIFVKRGRGLETSYIRAMPKLCLSVCAHHLPMVTQRKHVADLLLAAELCDALCEHHHVVRHRVRPCKQEVPIEVLRVLVRVVRDHVAELFVGHDDAEAVPPLLKFFHSGFLIVVQRGHNFWMLLH